MRTTTITSLSILCLAIAGCGGLVEEPKQQLLLGDKSDVAQNAPSCTADADCGSGYFCSFDPGACLLPTFNIMTGTCAWQPEACAMIYAPVCGCDGKTYGNACSAANAGVSVASQGECQGSGGGGQPGCYADSDCASGEFCKLDDGMCLLPTFAPLQGECTDQPSACTREFMPVCGCDGKTYGNPCNARAAGVSVASKGACSGSGGGGGGNACYANGDCASGEFCKLDDGMCLLPTFAPLQGECTDQPSACTREFMPVCGCDGKTYGNPCNARAAGVSVASQGACN